MSFTFLPIVFQDDSQVYSVSQSWKDAPENRYEIQIFFLALPPTPTPEQKADIASLL